jgi:hypothetical protein
MFARMKLFKNILLVHLHNEHSIPKDLITSALWEIRFIHYNVAALLNPFTVTKKLPVNC